MEEAKSYAEIYEILKLMEKKYIEKIPKDYLEIIEKERDKDYFPNIRSDIPLDQQGLTRNTFIILADFYLNYWGNDEEKKKLKEELIENDKGYNRDKLFNNKNVSAEIIVEEKSLMQLEDKNKISDFFEKIVQFFNKLWSK